MSINHLKVFSIVLVVFGLLNEVRGVKLYGKESIPLSLQCKNITEGRFVSVVWLTNAGSDKSKYTAFSYEASTRTKRIHQNFFGRVKQINGTSIQIDNPQLSDSGNWECNIIYIYQPKDKWEETRRRVSVLANYDVIIVSPPIIRRVYPQLVAAPLSYQKSAVCEAYSPNPFTLTWVKINGGFTSYASFDHRESFVNTEYRWISHIFFNNLTTADTGRYLCVAKNLAGQVSREVDVHIQAKPKILNRNEASRYKANIQKDAQLECVAIGYPRVSFTWVFTYNYEQIQLQSAETRNGGRFTTSKTKFTFFRGKELSTSSLTVKNVDSQNWGVYECIAENTIGYDSIKIELFGYGLPDPPAILHTDDIETDRITLYWLLDKSNGIINSVVIDRRQPGMQWDSVEIPDAITSYTYIDLDGDTFYEFRLRSRNNVGLSGYSEIKKLKTKMLKVTGSKSQAKSPKSNKKIFLNLDVISLTAICGGILLLFTCFIAATCVVVQDRRYRRRKKVKRQQQTENKNLIPLNRQTSQLCQTL